MQKIGKGLGVCRAAIAAVRSGMRRHPITFWDVGARRGLSAQMNILYHCGVLRPIFFEPDPDEAVRLAREYPDAQVFSYALWNLDGQAILHLTKDDLSESSLLRPLDESKVLRTLTVPTRRADTLVADAAADYFPDIIKLDIEGGELAALNGFGNRLDDVACIETEVSFRPDYVDQPLLEDIVEYLMERGFGLADLRVFGAHSTRAATYANAFFVRRALKDDKEAMIDLVFRYANRIVLA